MGRPVDPPRQAADDRQPGPTQTRRQTLRLTEPVLRGVARAHDGDRQGVLRLDLAADKEHAGRVVDLAEDVGIRGVRVGHDRHAPLAAQGNLVLRVDLVLGCGDLAHELGANTLDLAKFARRGPQHRRRGPEPLEQGPPRPRPDAGDQRQAERVDQGLGIPLGSRVLVFRH